VEVEAGEAVVIGFVRRLWRALVNAVLGTVEDKRRRVERDDSDDGQW
jgi:hypothetical protein